jgi:hypothetical protein
MQFGRMASRQATEAMVRPPAKSDEESFREVPAPDSPVMANHKAPQFWNGPVAAFVLQNTLSLSIIGRPTARSVCHGGSRFEPAPQALETG